MNRKPLSRNPGAKRARTFRRRQKLGLRPVALELPWRDVVMAWLIRENLPLDTPATLLPIGRIRHDLEDLVVASARRWLALKKRSP